MDRERQTSAFDSNRLYPPPVGPRTYRSPPDDDDDDVPSVRPPTRSQVTPDDPKLWNALGDLHMEDAPYLEAWTRSGGRNARSKRSLGRSALRRRDYASAAEHLEAAVALNPLNVESWFSLGYCYVKLEKAEPALRVRVGSGDIVIVGWAGDLWPLGSVHVCGSMHVCACITVQRGT